MSQDGLPPRPDASADEATRCGYVALVGAPNVGKSTLMNVLVGEELSIVTEKPQTTWSRILGIRTGDSRQFVFLDTPGLMEPSSLLHRSLIMGSEEALREADAVVVLADPVTPIGEPGRARIEATIRVATVPRVGVVNKTDIAQTEDVHRERGWLETVANAGVFDVSARTGEGTAELLEAVGELLPVGPFLFPDDEIASAPVRFFVAEMVREAIFERYHEEVPYATICRVEEFREEKPRTYIQVTAYVERESQKGILVGKGGTAIRALGIAARERIEHFLERPVYLDLWVKVLPNWRRRPDQLRRLGLPVPTEDRAP